jgi:hypothetical protein
MGSETKAILLQSRPGVCACNSVRSKVVYMLFPWDMRYKKGKGNNSWVEQFIRDGKTVLDPCLPFVGDRYEATKKRDSMIGRLGALAPNYARTTILSNDD